MHRLKQTSIPAIKDDEKIVAENQDWNSDPSDKEILLAKFMKASKNSQ